MKKICLIISFAISAFIFWSCSSEVMSTYDGGTPCSTIRIFIKDSHGNNLLSSETEGNWRGQPFKILFNDSIYTTTWANTLRPINEWMIARFDGLVAWRNTIDIPDSVYITNCLEFGQFPGNESFELEFKFFVPGDDIPYNFRYEHEAHFDLWRNSSEETIILDGKEHKGSAVTIVLAKRKNFHDCENP